jgi:hypothetical protein
MRVLDFTEHVQNYSMTAIRLLSLLLFETGKADPKSDLQLNRQQGVGQFWRKKKFQKNISFLFLNF